MDKKRGRPVVKPEIDEDKLGLNPMIDEEGYEFTFPVGKGAYDVTNKFELPDKKEYMYEKTPFTKVYEVAGLKDMTSGLPVRAKEMLLHIVLHIESSKDWIWINRKKYMEDNGIKSVNTYKTAYEQLSCKRYICPHVKIKDLFWVNPKNVFKGNRIAKYPNSVREVDDKKPKQ